MDPISGSMRDPNGGNGPLHLHRMDAMAPTIARLSPLPLSPTRELDHSRQSTSLNAMCKAGTRSLHDYRQYMSSYDSATVERPDSKTLRRKNAALNLNQSQMSLDNIFDYPFSASSVASSPPPLSPSHSPCALSEHPESLDGFLCMRYCRYISPIDPCLLANLAPGTPCSVDMNSEYAYLKQNPNKILVSRNSLISKYGYLCS
jgi:hypothetical protein